MCLHRVMNLHRRCVEAFDNRRAFSERRIHVARLALAGRRGVGHAFPNLGRTFFPGVVLAHDKALARLGRDLDGMKGVKARLFARRRHGGDLLPIIPHSERSLPGQGHCLDAGEAPRFVKIDRQDLGGGPF